MNTPHPQPDPNDAPADLRLPHIAADGPPHFLPYQRRWIADKSPLKIIEKSRQIGLTYADAYDSVRKACGFQGRYDTFFSTRDEPTARRYIELCKDWARYLNLRADYLGFRVIDTEKDLHAHDLRLSSGLHIYSLSSSPDALVGKTGHIKLDEFAVHRDGGQLFRVAQPGTLWGGQLAIISTPRGECSVFNEILRDIKERGNRMRWSHHRVTLEDALDQGLLERINYFKVQRSLQAALADEPVITDPLPPVAPVSALSRPEFIADVRGRCLDEEHWLQEYCCVPVADSALFLSLDLITPCEAPGCLFPFELLLNAGETAPPLHGPLYAGVDIGRHEHLCVIDLAEQVGDVFWDRLRLELRGQSFAEMKRLLFAIMKLPRMQRACIDATGLGMQLAEEAQAEFGWQAEPVTFTPALKERLAFGLRTAFEQRLLRIDGNPALRADLLSMRRDITKSGNVRFLGESNDGHCDRFWAMALRQHAATARRKMVGAAVA